jgi:hypothetical protein
MASYTVRAVCADSEKPVECLVQEFFEDSNKSSKPVFGRTRDGLYTSRSPNCIAIGFRPTDAHWTRILELDDIEDLPIVGGASVFELEPLSDLHAPWWMHTVGAVGSSMAQKQAVRIGIVDRVFKAPNYLQHIKFIDGARYVDPILRRHKDPYDTHGHAVSALLAARNSGSFNGVASEAEFYFADANPDADGTDEDYATVISAAVVDGIKRLVGQHDVQLINLSLGFQEDLRDVKAAIAKAWEAGCLCLAGAGNRGRPSLMFPARLSSVVGVGGMAIDWASAPSSSMLSRKADEARAQQLIGRTILPPGGAPYWDVHADYGSGLDVVAPSISVTFPTYGSLTSEYNGTSYSAPIVTGVLARFLAADEGYHLLAGAERSQYAMDALEKMSNNNHLPTKRKCRFGMPSLDGC